MRKSLLASLVWCAVRCHGYTAVPTIGTTARSPLGIRNNSKNADGALSFTRTRPLDAALVSSDLPDKSRWHRRVLSTVWRQKSSSSSADMVAGSESFSLNTNRDTAHTRLSDELRSQFITIPSLQQQQEDILSEAETVERASLLIRPLRTWLQNILYNLIDQWSQGAHQDLMVQCEPTPSLRDLVRQGIFTCHASLTFRRLDFGHLRLSGGRLEAHHLALNIGRFSRITAQAPRFARAFDFVATDFVWTQDDLFTSDCIRNGLRQLLKNILTKRHIRTSAIDIDAIQILSNGKLSVRGRALSTHLGTTIPFEVRTGVGTASRGHILTLPGLEISLSPELGLFVPVLPEMTLDLGHNAQIKRVHLNGSKAQLELSARVTITPKHTIKLQKYIQSSNAYRSKFSIDVGRWLTSVGQFSN
jgi:hypothetical protein